MDMEVKGFSVDTLQQGVKWAKIGIAFVALILRGE